MTLIKSISGIRGTIGGVPGAGLTPPDIVRFVSAFAAFIRENGNAGKLKFVVGRDARVSGDMVNRLVCGTLMGMGVDVVDAGLSTTPTIEMKVLFEPAHAGIILTASHNPANWNALKLLNGKGEFISATDGIRVLELAAEQAHPYAEVGDMGKYVVVDDAIRQHIEAIMALPLVDREAISKKNFHIAVDAVNSTGGIAIPMLLRELGVDRISCLNCEANGLFAHDPEPLPENLTGIARVVRENGADLGFVVDPDVDRLAIITEKGEMFGEEYTLVAVADYVLRHNPGNTVSNLSSTAALGDVTIAAGGKYYASAVGEVNVVEMMKEVDAVIGGEGNGGVIYPALHHGRDALAGIALFLSFLARENITCSELKGRYPQYHISKNKIRLEEGTDVDELLVKAAGIYSRYECNTVDGLRITLPGGWVHLRKSNTEPVIRIYAESESMEKAGNLANEVINNFRKIQPGS
jgi:phosphomannomutase